MPLHAKRREARTNAKLTEIAINYFDVPTLEYRHRDSLDFHEVSVGQMKDALRAAYKLGRKTTLCDHSPCKPSPSSMRSRG